MFSYPYDPLATIDKDHAIRLLELLPGTGLIKCRLNTVFLSEEPYFEALSYCWGSAFDQRRILVNGRDFEVTANLHAALKRLRLPNKSRTLWVDRICINQEDIDERNAQVRIMSHIFESCAQCCVWLGEGNRRTRRALKVIPIQAEMSSHLADDAHYGQHAQLFSKRILSHPRLRFKGLPRIARAYHNVTWQPWFLRSWIVQEISIPKKILTYCGKQEIDWALFENANKVKFGGISTNLRRLITTRRRVQDQGVRTISWLLALHFSTQAEDPRDKLYSLFGLLHNSTESSITIDYNKPVPDVFLQYTQSCLRAVPNLDVLSLAWGCADQLATEPSPSWVINWRRDWNTDVYPWDVLAYCAERRGQGFRACSDAPSEVRLSGKILTVSGYQFDEVTEVCESYISYNDVLEDHFKSLLYFNHKNMIRHNQWYDYYKSWTKAAPPSMSEKGCLDEFARICACVSQRSYRNESAIQETYEAYQQVTKIFRRFARVHGYDISLLYKLGYIPLHACHYMNSRLWNTMVVWEQDSSACLSRRLFRTKGGYIGLGPLTLKPGDQITLLRGASIPYALRAAGANWRLVGETYVHKIMQGEAWSADKCHDINIE